MNERITARITDEAVEALRAEIGREISIPQYNTTASEDAIRHYALGLGDDNPLWTDRSYAANTWRGGITALPTFVMSCGFPRSRGLAGIHGLFSGIDLVCHKPIKAGMRIRAATGLHELNEKEGRYAGRTFQQIARTRYIDEQGDVLSELFSHAFRTDRKEGSKKGKYSDIERQHYTEDELQPIIQHYKNETRARRSSVPRYFEDVSVGEEIFPLVKGPLTVTDCICFLMGFGYIYVKAHRQWYAFLDRHPGAGVKDPFGVYDVPERVHWEEDLAKSIGMPAAYDYGPQRIGWFDHCVHDWMGDDGWMKRLQVRLSGPNFIGDTSWIKGEIIEKVESDHSVTIKMECIDQRGRVTATGSAFVMLPTKDGKKGLQT